MFKDLKSVTFIKTTTTTTTTIATNYYERGTLR